MSDLPAPLVPSNTDLTQFPFMMVEVQKFLKSDTWYAAGENSLIAYVSVNLWFKSFHQIPASSLPNDDGKLAKIADCSLKKFQSVKSVVMKGWILCSDGRLYHKTVAERVLDAWIKKLEKKKKAKINAAKSHKKEPDVAEVTNEINEAKKLLKYLNKDANSLIVIDEDVASSSTSSTAGSTAASRATSSTDSTAASTAKREGEGERDGEGKDLKAICAEASSTHKATQSSSEAPLLTHPVQPDLLPEPKMMYQLILAGGKKYFSVTDDYITQMKISYPAVDMEKEFLRMQAWLVNNPRMRKTSTGITRFINSWLDKAQNEAKAGKQRGEKLSEGKWSGFEEKDYTKGVGADFSF